LGGIFATADVLNTPAKAAALARVVDAYDDAANELERRPLRYARLAAAAFAKYFASTGVPMPPAPMIAASLWRGDLVYRTDIPLAAVRTDLLAWLKEVAGSAPDQDLIAGQAWQLPRPERSQLH
jgi:hypothetical protein